MVKDDRPTGRIVMASGPYGVMDFFSEEARKFHEVMDKGSIEEGTACPGCESPVTEETGVECYCEAEGFSRQHETWLWCSRECQYKTHEIPYSVPSHPNE